MMNMRRTSGLWWIGAVLVSWMAFSSSVFAQAKPVAVAHIMKVRGKVTITSSATVSTSSNQVTGAVNEIFPASDGVCRTPSAKFQVKPSLRESRWQAEHDTHAACVLIRESVAE